jgi:hypothetical protein
MRLIGTFESDVESTGLTRGCPDFVFTVLTYAAVSLLKALQPQFSHLDPNRPSILATARKAADMLARAAMTPDHLPASQSVFLSRLIEAKSAEPALPPANTLQGNTAQTPWVPETIDFEALGHAIDAEQTTALWPPMPAMPNSNSNSAGINGWESFFDQVDGHGQAVVANHDPTTQPMAYGQANMAGFSAPGTTATGTATGTGNTNTDGPGAFHPPTDLSSWVAQNTYQGTVPGAEAALGLGGLGIGALGDGDMLFTQDSFW